MGDFYTDCRRTMDEMENKLDEIKLYMERLGLMGNSARSPKLARPKPKLKVICGGLQSGPTEQQEVQP